MAGQLRRSEARQANDSRVRETFQDCKLAEVLVEGDENPLLGMCGGQDRDIARVFGPQSRPYHIMAEAGECW